jgi:hypothetical protein
LGKVTIYLSDDLEDRVREAGISMSPVCQEALAEEVEQAEARSKLSDKMEPIRITLFRDWRDDSTAYEAEFVGQWLVYPEDWMGVALTERQGILCYRTQEASQGPRYEVYDSIEAAAATGDWDEEVLAEAAGQLGEDFLVRLNV